MKTRALFSTALLLGALTLTSVSFVGCSKESSVVDPTSTESLLVATIPDPAMEQSELTDCTMDMDMSLAVPPTDARRQPFGPFLRKLNLTDDQKTTVKDLLKAHEDCVKSATEALRTAEREIMARYKSARREIMDSVKSGALTREDAKAKLDTLNAAARQELKGLDEERAAAADALLACRETLMNGINDVLTDEQKALLADWLANDAPRDPKGRRPEPPRNSRPKR